MSVPTGVAPATGTAEEHLLGPVTDIPVGEGRSYVVDGEQVAVFRLRSGRLHATQATCPHRGGPLADGQLDEQVVVCPLHAYAWELATGRRAGEEPGGDALRVHRVRLDEDGQVVVALTG